MLKLIMPLVSFCVPLPLCGLCACVPGAGGHALMQSHPGMYARLVSHSPDTVDLEIMRDLNRTFPNHVFFHQRQGPGQQSLFHVLRAYSALDKQVCADVYVCGLWVCVGVGARVCVWGVGV